MDIVSKVRKLFALATSPNENEARSALLKARALMAEHKLTEADIQESRSEILVHLVSSEVSWEPGSEHSWIPRLADLLASQQRSAVSWAPGQNGYYSAVITGLADDAAVAKASIEYACGFVQNKLKDHAVIYADGFIAGLEIALEIQNAEHPEYALVLSQPKELKDFLGTLKEEKAEGKASKGDYLAYLKGVNDGMRFPERKVIE